MNSGMSQRFRRNISILSFTTLLLILSPLSSHGTAQMPDKLLSDGRELSLCTNPLDDYFAVSGDTLPHERVVIQNTGCWRGYVASWVIESDSLFLVRVEVMFAIRSSEPTRRWTSEWREVPLATWFTGSTLRQFASWYTGTLRIPMGDLLHYVHMGYASTYERDSLIDVSRGKVTGRAVRSNFVPERWICPQDQRWCEPPAGRNDTGDFIDLRVIWAKRLADWCQSGKVLRTRGIAITDSSRVRLVVPRTECSDEVDFELHFETAQLRFPTDSQFIEIEASWVMSDDYCELASKSWRPLVRGESIHSPDYPLWSLMLNH